MFISLIELKGFKRVSLNNIETIRITPVNKFQWILGTNGSGKSCLIREFTPLGATPNDYHKGGYKKLELTDKGIFYRLLNDFSGSKNIFSFIKVNQNGQEEELNLGHTSTVFNNLVFQIFGITKDIHDLSIGRKVFHDLSPNERKNWFTRLSETDFTFALSYFQKLTTHYRDTLGSIKIDQNRLLEIKAKLVSPEEEKLLIADIEFLKERLQSLMEICPNPSTPSHVIKERFLTINQKITKAYQTYKTRLQKERHLFPLGSIKELQDQVNVLESELMYADNSIKNNFDTLEKIDQELRSLQDIQGLNDSTLKSNIKTDELKYIEIKSLLLLSLEISDPKALLSQVDSWMSEMSLIVESLIEDPNESFNKEDYDHNVAEHKRGENFIVVCQTQIDFRTSKIQEIKDCENHTDLQCPKCDHLWKPGYRPEEIIKLQTEIDNLKEKKLKALSKMEELQTSNVLYEKYQQGLAYLNNFVWTHNDFRPFWEMIFFSKLHIKSPKQILSKAFELKQDLSLLVEMQFLLDSIEVYKKQLSLLQEKSSVDFKSLRAQREKLDSEIQTYYDFRDKKVKHLQYLNQKKSLWVFIDTAAWEAKSVKETMDQLFMASFEHFQREKLSEFILSSNTEILSKEKLIRSIEIQKAQVNSLQENISLAEDYAKALKLAVDALSPSEGMIARGLTGFINHFVSLMNGLIQKVWLYPMELIPILPDENNEIDLDYRFEVRVNNEITPDVKDCSSGQQEIIDFAFTVVALTFLHLDHGPLALDEFAVHMDAAHRASAFNAVYNLLANSNFSQIFVVSHYENTYNSQIDSDITVLCPANIQLPDGLVYNQQTKIN